MTIDWKYVTRQYNEEKNTDLSEREMFESLYRKHRSIRRAADDLGVSYVPFSKRMNHLGIKKGPKGGVRTSILDGVDIAGKTAAEVARSLSCSIHTVYAYAVKHNIDLKYLREDWRRDFR